MILIVTDNIALRQDLAHELKRAGHAVRTFTAKSMKSPVVLYDEELQALVIDRDLPHIPKRALEDTLNSMAKRIPVIVCQNVSSPQSAADKAEGYGEQRHFSDDIMVLFRPNVIDVMASLHAYGALEFGAKNQHHRDLSFYNPQIPMRMLQNNHGVSVLAIDASAFRKIEIEYGAEVYEKTKSVFQGILVELWGDGGCFRGTDIICRRSTHGNIYYVFLNRPRHQGGLPKPGVLERIAGRVSYRLQNALWNEVFKNGKQRRLPECIRNAPEIAVGFSAALYNPCLDTGEIVDRVIDASMGIAKIQLHKMQNLHKELMHTLIQDQQLLHSHFQGIFNLKKITKDHVLEVEKMQSIAPLASELYGFEALVRVRTDLLDSALDKEQEIMESRHLKPDVLFNLAKSTKTSLELDQACLRSAAVNSVGLPGQLMVNILPRNLYFIKQLCNIFEDHKRLIFEVSESEAISNFDLMNQVLSFLRQRDIGIAADDFGRGFAGLERVIQIQPEIIKFDRSLISNIHEDPIKHAYVSGLVKAAKMLNTIVLAEGIEQWEEAAVLKDLGIDLVQGFLFHRPQTKDHILLQLAQAEHLKSHKITKLHTVA